jgi:2-keto-4-pentenoate hydratase/2-oxohepta-3-ene-1,7-dioic acid hydratase in catechol pathway
MKLVTFEVDGRQRAGLIDGGDIIDIHACDPSLPDGVRGILEAGALERVRGLVSSPKHRTSQAGAKLLAPIPNPGIVLAAGMNYYEHLKEMNTPVPERPAAFTKSVASIIGSGQPIKVPPGSPDMLDWEGEFSVIIGKSCHRVGAGQALDYVAGYTLVNDVSARDWVASIFSAQGIMGPIHAWEHNILGKMFPTFCPMGPALVTKDELPNPDEMHIETRLNGRVMQSAGTDDLVFSVAKLIEYYSQFFLFQPGDVITTGSPSGVGYGRNPKVFMKPGDVIEVEVKEIGVLRNPVER